MKGNITAISALPSNDKTFSALVELPEGLITNTGLKLNFRLGMSASAEIVTKEMSLLERLISGIKKSFEVRE